MNLEDQVCSLEYAKRLKELGVKQDSYFVWFKLQEKENWDLSENWQIDDIERFDTISAFGVAELGQLLPKQINDDGDIYELHCCFDPKGGCYVFYVIDDQVEHEFKADYSEANARAIMLIYLLENNLMEIPIMLNHRADKVSF